MRHRSAEMRLTQLSQHMTAQSLSSASATTSLSRPGRTMGVMPGAETAVPLPSQAATRCGPGGTLTAVQIESYVRDG